MLAQLPNHITTTPFAGRVGFVLRYGKFYFVVVLLHTQQHSFFPGKRQGCVVQYAIFICPVGCVGCVLSGSSMKLPMPSCSVLKTEMILPLLFLTVPFALTG